MIKRFIILAFLLLFCGSGWAATYYISQSTGNDSNTGLSHAQAWKELDKLETSFSSGDKVLFYCGDTWDKDLGDWGTTGVEANLDDITNLTIGAYYYSGGEIEVDGSTYTCPGNNPKLDGGIETHVYEDRLGYAIIRIREGSSGITIQDIDLVDYHIAIMARQADGDPGAISNIIVRRCNIDNIGVQALRFESNPLSDDNVSYIEVYDNIITNVMMALNDNPNWGCSVQFKTADNYTAYHNIVGQGHGEGICAHSGADHGTIYENIVYDHSSVQIYTSTSHDISVYRNYVMHTNTTDFVDDANGRTVSGIGLGEEGDGSGYIECSGVKFYYNVVFGQPTGGIRITATVDDSDDTTDGGYGENYFYNNTLIDNTDQFYVADTTCTTCETNVTFKNNISIINDTSQCDHTRTTNAPHSGYTFAGNGWDNSEAVDSDYTHASDVTGDPSIVDPTACNANGWFGCAAYNTPDWGDGGLGSGSAFINVAANLGASYDDGLDQTSTWPSNVTTLDQDDYGSWEFGAYVYGGTAVETKQIEGGICSGCIINQ